MEEDGPSTKLYCLAMHTPFIFECYEASVVIQLNYWRKEFIV